MPASTIDNLDKLDKLAYSTNTHAQLLQTAKQVILTEQQAVSRLLDSINDDFIKACELLINCKGRIVVTGIGKSGHIGNKIAASFASLGSPAFFLHAAEALHGDIGMLAPNDIVIALSYSGSSNEILGLIPSIKYLNIPIIAITGDPNSLLAHQADIHLAISIDKEACYLNLAPTASTTATLVLADALTMAVTRAKQFTEADFARSHPGGNLGRRLLLTVADIMVTKDKLPLASLDTNLAEVLLIMSSKGLGMVAIVDLNNHQEILGIFTDGDLRRFFNSGSNNNSQLKLQSLEQIKISTIMRTNCTTVPENTLAVNAWQIMSSKKINGLLITEPDTNYLIGMLNIHSLTAAKII
ncbi:MAG: KpsF/GutQ family sugar-phosphate isomerase [Gammaproteobacteria bacterium]|nr:KpsF/GutQ family sugar-phosphate isomerase [Gammaproteobacteria bacterium]